MRGAPSLDRLPRWLAITSTKLSEMATTYADFYAVIHPLLCQGYEEAGKPYGPSDVGMWRWWEEQAAVDRERWLSMHRTQRIRRDN